VPPCARAAGARRIDLTRIRTLLLYAASDENATFSYQQTWPRGFLGHPRFDSTAINLAGRRAAARLAAEARIRLWRGDAVVLLHSVFSNARTLSDRCFAAVQKLAVPKAFFIGNEYKLMPEKMRFCEELPVRLLISQSSCPAVHRLYRERLGCAVAGIPNSGFDPDVFRPCADPAGRPIDLGYRTQDAPFYLGHTERRDIAEYFQARAAEAGLTVDISMSPEDRFTVPEWAAFLNRCKGQLGVEAGGDFFELTDRTRLAVNEYMQQVPGATFADIWERFFKNYRDPVPLRIISSRHVEAAGTRTTQMLFEGEYDGYFKQDVHYIPWKKDFSNADEAIAKFRDPGVSAAIAGNAYELAHAELTYDRLLDRFASTLEPLL
jgi:hypothetical protein